MLGQLLKRKARHHHGRDQAAFQSTTFSLSGEVPRPAERRSDPRVSPVLRIAKLVHGETQQLIKVCNISAGGMMAELANAVSIGEAVVIELNGQRIPAQVVWTRPGTVGLKFDQDIDIGELLAGRKQRYDFRPRPPRLEVECPASLRIGRKYYQVEVHDISLGGMKVEPIDEYCLGHDVVVVIESFRPVKGQVRWYSDRKAGIVFDEALSFEELADWVGRRIEVATLNASRKPR